MHLLSAPILWMRFVKILMIASQTEKKTLILFDDMIADIVSNKKIQAVVNELFFRSRKVNISLVFIIQSYFSVPKYIRLNSSQHLIMKINKKRELQNIARSHSANIDYKDFMKIYRDSTKELYYFLTIDTTLPASDPLRFMKILFHSYKNGSN